MDRDIGLPEHWTIGRDPVPLDESERRRPYILKLCGTFVARHETVEAAREQAWDIHDHPMGDDAC